MQATLVSINAIRPSRLSSGPATPTRKPSNMMVNYYGQIIKGLLRRGLMKRHHCSRDVKNCHRGFSNYVLNGNYPPIY
eukprot:scaffold246015_cov22-Prasinocladus_malaysianus.AAC.1